MHTMNIYKQGGTEPVAKVPVTENSNSTDLGDFIYVHTSVPHQTALDVASTVLSVFDTKDEFHPIVFSDENNSYYIQMQA